MPFTRSNNKAIAAVQRLAKDLADKIYELADYLKGLVTSQDPDWMGRIREWMRWILEKMREFCQRMAWAVGCKRSSLADSSEMTEASSSAKGDMLKALDMAKQRATILSYAEDLYGDDFMLGEELYEALEEVKAKVLELKDGNEETDDYEEEAEEEMPNEDDAEMNSPAPKKMRFA